MGRGIGSALPRDWAEVVQRLAQEWGQPHKSEWGAEGAGRGEVRGFMAGSGGTSWGDPHTLSIRCAHRHPGAFRRQLLPSPGPRRAVWSSGTSACATEKTWTWFSRTSASPSRVGRR